MHLKTAEHHQHDTQYLNPPAPKKLIIITTTMVTATQTAGLTVNSLSQNATNTAAADNSAGRTTVQLYLKKQISLNNVVADGSANQ